MVLDSEGRHAIPPSARRFMIVTAIAVAIFVVITGVVIFVTRPPTSDSAATFHRGDWQAPPEALLSSPMRVRPVPGWRVRMTDLGLPESAVFADTELTHEAEPFVGAMEKRAYFMAMSTTDPRRWLVGLDLSTGRPLFSPVSIDPGPDFVKCFVNGPDQVLCAADGKPEGKTATIAWVVDTRTGEVVFNGPTDLHVTPGSGSHLKQVGSYVVAEIQGKGLSGVGPRAETTWLIPDAKKVTPTDRNADTAAPRLAVAEDLAGGPDHAVVFSVVDGTVITPDLGADRTPERAVVHPQGFAILAAGKRGSGLRDTVLFFDNAGNRVGESGIQGSLSDLSMVLPMVQSAPSYTVFGANGAGLIQLPGEGLDAVLIGHRLYAPESEWDGPVKVRQWRQFDLRTGEEGTACLPNMQWYIANDGQVGVFETSQHETTGATFFGMDLTTCEKLWTVPVNWESFHRLWRIDDTLVELSDDGKELHSLVAPA
ncbi:hypothetical protein MI170_23855 [Mycolicibacterium goodii]|uniref:hypothetical protein n=1 Tax=Mycolicibacterium goodii TaxID=134601 RepID=UPI001F03AE1C|nr:hypothetical protein [Mycolicibacterium goodii]ULN46304.1 hypothetical protein MI170_23855 [Mycolicibacterium goodii]